MNTFIRLLNQIEDLVLNSGSLPLTPWVLVNADKLVALMDALRDRMPEEIQAAQHLVHQQDALIEQARQQALGLEREAYEQRERLLSESELMHAIQEEAHRTRTQLVHELENLKQETLLACEQARRDAEEEACHIRHAAREYAAELLREAEQRLAEIHQQVSFGAQQLRSVQVGQAQVENRVVTPSRHGRPQRRQPRPKLASQQLPLMSSQTSSEDQVEMALRLLNPKK